MKAKHTIARIKGMSIWQKIICALMAVLLLSLMVPNGLRANATEENENLGSTTEEVKIENNAGLQLEWPKVNSTMNFTRASVNADDTAGCFTKQSLDLSIVDFVHLLYEKFPSIAHIIKPHPENEIELAETIASIDEFFDYTSDGPDLDTILDALSVLLSHVKDTPVEGDYLADLKKAVWLPSDFPFVPGVDNTLKYINHIVPVSELTGIGPTVVNDGSIYFLYVTLGEGNIVDVIANTTIHVGRIIPIMPALNLTPHMTKMLQSDAALTAENSDTRQARFLNWEISLDNGRTFVPFNLVYSILDEPLPIYSDSSIVFKANFFDLEGWTKVNIDFGTEVRENKIVKALEAEGWWSTSPAGYGRVWTNIYPSFLPAWVAYQDIFDTMQNLYEEEDRYVYKDTKLKIIYDDFVHTNGEANPELKPVFPGAHWAEFSTGWFDTLDKETTLTFSWYPVSPMGHINHGTLSDIVKFSGKPPINPDLGKNLFSVSYADVMFYNEWGMPLFNYKGAIYDREYSTDLPGELGYGFYTDATHETLDYCYDEQIDHVVIKAKCFDPKTMDPDIYNTGDAGAVYIPVRYEADSINWTDFLFTHCMDFQVDALMFGGFAPGFPTALDNYVVSYYEDGELLFDPITLDNFWAINFFSMPMATNGTLSVDANGDLVSTFNAYFDFWRPWAVDPLNAFKDPEQFDPTPGVTHTFQCKIHANPTAGNMVHDWDIDYVFHLAIGQAIPVTDFLAIKLSNNISLFDEYVFAPHFTQASSVSAAGTEGHAAFHIDYFVNDTETPAFTYDYPGGSQAVYAGTKFGLLANGALYAIHDDSTLLTQDKEGAIVVPVALPGYQFVSWTINGVTYPVGTAVEAATATADSPVSIVANYAGGGINPGPDPVNPGGAGTAQTGDSMGFAFAILAMIAIAGASVLAGRKLYNK